MKKSIKNQYIALKEGKMTEAQFMRNVRMTLPEYISNVTLFKQAERILINKGIIQEGIHDRDILSAPHTNIKSLEQSPEQLSKAADNRSENILRMTYRKQIQDPNISDDELKYILNGKGVKGFGGRPNAINKIIADRNSDKIGESLREAKDTSATGYYNQDGKEQYGKFNELDNMNAQEIMAGYVMEKQDNPNIDIKEAIKTVIKNLKKDQFYYTNYKLTGIRDLPPTEFTTTKRKPFFDQMEEVNKNGDNFVDEKNKMQVVKESKKNKMKNKINESQRIRQLAGLITESQLLKEDKLEDIKFLLSDETLRNSDIGYSSGDEVSITYKNSKKLPFEDFSKLEDEYIIYKDELSNEPYRVQYFIGDKSIKTPSKPKPSYDDEDVFENYDNKERQAKDLKKFSDRMIGKPSTAQNIMKPDTKNKLKEMVRKMMKEMFDGRDNLTDIE